MEPQSATNYNLGLVGRLDTLDISFDYFNYEYEDLVLPGGSAQSIVNATPNGPAVLRDAAGQLNAVFTGFEIGAMRRCQGLISTPFMMRTGSIMAICHSMPM